MAFPAALLPAAPSWYPGHMHAFNKMLPTLLSRTDIVLELRDTRMPLTSINPTFESTVARWRADRKMKAGSCCERFIIYGKKDLVSPWGLKPFQRAMEHLHPSEKFVFTARDDARALRGLHKMLVNVAKRHSHSHTELNVTIIGMPNVGKSTLLNGLRGVGIPGTQPKALRTSALPGMTRALSTRLKLHRGNAIDKDKLRPRDDDVDDVVHKGDSGNAAPDASAAIDRGCPIYAYDTPGLMLPFLGNGIQGAERGVKLGLIAAVKEGMYDYDFLATYLVHRMNFLHPESPAYLPLLTPKSHATSKHKSQHLPVADILPPSGQLDAEEFLELLAERRGMMLKGARPDTMRAAQWLVQWWREQGGALVGGRSRRGWGFDFEFMDTVDQPSTLAEVDIEEGERDLFGEELARETRGQSLQLSDADTPLPYEEALPDEEEDDDEYGDAATGSDYGLAPSGEDGLTKDELVQLQMEEMITKHFASIDEETQTGGRVSATREKKVARAELIAKRKAKQAERFAAMSAAIE